MPGLSVILFLPDDSARTGLDRPLMLWPVQGAPLLAWLADSLFAAGVGRFFLVCGERFTQRALACFPREAEVTTAMDSEPADLLHVFLSTAGDSETHVTIVTGPTAYLPHMAAPRGQRVPVCTADRCQLMAALDETFSFPQFLRENCAVLSDNDGFYPIDSLSALLDAGRLLHEERMLRLLRKGVQIYDPHACYVEPTVEVEPGAVLLPGTMLRGRSLIREGAVIGPQSTVEDAEIGPGARVTASVVEGATVGAAAEIGPYAHLRPGAVLERGVKIGNFVEVKNSHIGENTWASHLSYLGDADVGAGVNLGCGTVTVNFDRVEKHRTTIGDRAFVGCHSALIAPVRLGPGAYVAAGTVVTDDVPAEALAIARTKQSNKKDWAVKHKRAKE